MDQQPPDFVQSPYSAPNAAVPRAAGPRRGKRVAAVIAAVVLGIVFVLAAGAFAWVQTTPKLEAMLPPDVPAAADANLTWWWNAASPIRRVPSVQSALDKWQNEEHISVDKDILPWAGQGGAALLHYDQASPQNIKLAIFIQVHDWIAFARFVHRMESRLPASSPKIGPGEPGKQSSYDGVPIQIDTIPGTAGRAPTLIETAMLHGWFVTGVGAGSLEKVLDVYTGKQKSLASSAAWQTAQRHLPTNAVGWSAVRMDSLLADAPQQAAMKVPTAKLGYLTVTSFTAPDSGMRWDAVSVPTNPTTRRTLQQFAANQTVTITPAALKSAPNGTVATFITSNATGQLNNLIDQVGTAAATISPVDLSNAKAQVAKLGNLSGLAELSLVINPNGTGGASAFADAATPQTALKTVSLLKSQLGAVPLSATSSQVVPKLGPNFMDSLKLVTMIQGSRVQLATSGGLLSASTPTGAPYLAFPAEASGASWFGAGNFRFLPALRSWAAAPSNAGVGQPEAKEFLNDLGLDNAQWVTWARTDPSGGWQQQTTMISNWQWRAALNNLVNSTIKDDGKDSAPNQTLSPFTLPINAAQQVNKT